MTAPREPTTDREQADEIPAHAGERPPAPSGGAARAPAPQREADRHPTETLGTTTAAGASASPWRERFEDHGELARGGMSSIRRLHDRVMQRQVAMKVLDSMGDMAGAAHFAQEARITAQLDHPNIVPIYDVQHDEGELLPRRFTMKLVEGETLADVLEREARVRLRSDVLERLLTIFLKVCDAVGFAHSRGVIHCDIKPTNIMVGDHGQVYVMDWGVAVEPAQLRMAAARGQPVRAGTSMSGTPAYMAPEQAWGRIDEIDARTDVYGLGGLLYAMLTLAPPHNGDEPSHDLELARSGQVPPPRDLIDDQPLPPGLCRIAMRALYPDQERRYQTVEELSTDVTRFVRGGGWFETAQFRAGELIVAEGDVPDAAYIIADGTCEFFRQVDGRPRVMGKLHAGEVFGETSIFGDTARTASVAAVTDVSLVRVTRSALTRELERTEWLRAFVETLANRFIDLEHRIRAIEDAGGNPR